MAGYREQGFTALKMKVGASLREDVERVRAVREAIGHDCELMLDANMAWDVAEAGRRLRSLEPFDLAWLEEPLPPHDVAGLRGAPARHADPARGGRDALHAARVRALLLEPRDPDPAARRDPARGDGLAPGRRGLARLRPSARAALRPRDPRPSSLLDTERARARVPSDLRAAARDAARGSRWGRADRPSRRATGCGSPPRSSRRTGSRRGRSS